MSVCHHSLIFHLLRWMIGAAGPVLFWPLLEVHIEDPSSSLCSKSSKTPGTPSKTENTSSNKISYMLFKRLTRPAMTAILHFAVFYKNTLVDCLSHTENSLDHLLARCSLTHLFRLAAVLFEQICFSTGRFFAGIMLHRVWIRHNYLNKALTTSAR